MTTGKLADRDEIGVWFGPAEQLERDEMAIQDDVGPLYQPVSLQSNQLRVAGSGSHKVNLAVLHVVLATQKRKKGRILNILTSENRRSLPAAFIVASGNDTARVLYLRQSSDYKGPQRQTSICQA